jgi:hypothetical protein
MTIGNISNGVRFVPNQCATRLVALLPLLDGMFFIFFSCSDNFLEVEANKGTEEYRGYCRDVFHTVIQETLRPLVDAMHNGVLIRCSDGIERLCFPVLCQYIADMEEQVVLASIVKGWCPNLWFCGQGLGTRMKIFPRFCRGCHCRYRCRNFQAKCLETYHRHPEASDGYNQGSRNPRLLGDAFTRLHHARTVV